MDSINSSALLMVLSFLAGALLVTCWTEVPLIRKNIVKSSESLERIEETLGKIESKLNTTKSVSKGEG